MPETGRKSDESRGLSPQADKLIRFALENPDQFQAIADVVADRSLEKLNHRRTAQYKDALTSRFASLTEPSRINVGDLVVWKPLLKNRVRPAYDEPAVVIEVLDKPVRNTEADPSSTYFREPLDIVLGLLDDDDEILVYHFDSRRFMLAPATEE